jgi:hypothetical protein
MRFCRRSRTIASIAFQQSGGLVAGVVVRYLGVGEFGGKGFGAGFIDSGRTGGMLIVLAHGGIVLLGLVSVHGSLSSIRVDNSRCLRSEIQHPRQS